MLIRSFAGLGCLVRQKFGFRTVVFLILLIAFFDTAVDAENAASSYTDLSPCSLSSSQLRMLGRRDALDPCVLVDLTPPDDVATVKLTVVMVTNHRCSSHRDGALISAQKLLLNNHKIGFYQNSTVQFRFISLIAGNSDHMGAQAYDRQHRALLESVLQEEQPHYIIGTCSPLAHNEVDLALKYRTMLLAAVGPPAFYAQNNPWLFGMHLNSNDYAIDAVRRLQFWTQTARAPSVAVLYRTASEFFASTCQATVQALQQAGFVLNELSYNPTGDDSGNGTPNEFDVGFLHGLADQACHHNNTPALFLCTLHEHEIILRRLRANRCRPSSTWLTASTWMWAHRHIDQVAYFQGGSQWHEAMNYSDDYFASGADLLSAMEQQFGYRADYDAVVSYSTAQMLVQHLQAAYRVQDNPDPEGDFASDREYLRRQMVNLAAHTLFGPVQFDEHQRNRARGTAKSQWLPHGDKGYVNTLVSPIEQAQAAAVVPAPSAKNCRPGAFVNASLIPVHPALLTSKCSGCPNGSFTSVANQESSCQVCPDGTTTEDADHTICVRWEDNLRSNGVQAFGYLLMSLTWLLGGSAMVWLICNRTDPVVRLAQLEFLLLICVGAMISSSSILGLSFQAGTGEDTSRATAGCRAAPFLYATGWILQYGSLMSKTYRLYRIMKNEMRRVEVTALQSSWIVLGALTIDLSIVLAWTVVSPLEYSREITSRTIQENVITIESLGRCRLTDENDLSSWAFVAPIVVHHLVLMIATNYLLFQVRNVHDRYQEQKYIALAAVFVLEIVVVGLPVLVAAKDSVEASFVILTGVIGLADIGVLCFIFVPKILFQLKGLHDGVGVGESIMRSTHRRAVHRESINETIRSGWEQRTTVPNSERATIQSDFQTTIAHDPEQESDDTETGRLPSRIIEERSENASCDFPPPSRVSFHETESSDDVAAIEEPNRPIETETPEDEDRSD